MKQKLFYLIKIASSLLITCALGLEIGYFYLLLKDKMLPSQLNPFLWVGSIALIAHFVEGFIAGFKANTCDKNFITYGIYTFFVGFVGLLELQDILPHADRDRS